MLTTNWGSITKGPGVTSIAWLLLPLQNTHNSSVSHIASEKHCSPKWARVVGVSERFLSWWPSRVCSWGVLSYRCGGGGSSDFEYYLFSLLWMSVQWFPHSSFVLQENEASDRVENGFILWAGLQIFGGRSRVGSCSLAAPRWSPGLCGSVVLVG